MLSNLRATLVRDTSIIVTALGYIKARLGERSTYMGIVGAIGGAASLPAPWSYASVAVGIIAALIPTSGGRDAS